MSDKKQTAVQWLIEQIKEYDFSNIKDSENWVIKIPAWVLTEKKEQAKQMEKEQIVNAFNNGENKSAELYYNETYGNHISDVSKMVGGQDE